ncbi:MAG TPA: alpha/beta hydrolase, partial [Polyangia bacterium]
FFELAERRVQVASAPFGRVGVSYRELGAGEPLLLVHGLMTTSYSWRYVIDELARSWRVIAIDLPGCGRSDKPAGARYGGPEQAAFLVELVGALGLRGCRVVGNSMGGYLCMRAALADAGAFGRLVNIHSPGVPDWRYRALFGALATPGVAAALAWWIRRAPQRWAHRNVHYFDETLKSIEEAAEYGDPLATADGARAFIGYLKDALAPRDVAAFVAELGARRAAGQRFPIPLQLVYSRQDPLVPPSVGERLHALVPDAPLVWLESTSHFAHVDTPAAVVEALRTFL